MKPATREKKKIVAFQPATKQVELMSDVKKRKRQATKEKLKKRSQRAKSGDEMEKPVELVQSLPMVDQMPAGDVKHSKPHS